MGKITVTLSGETESALRRYVTQTYNEKPFGKISYIVEKAIKDFLSEVERKS